MAAAAAKYRSQHELRRFSLSLRLRLYPGVEITNITGGAGWLGLARGDSNKMSFLTINNRNYSIITIVRFNFFSRTHTKKTGSVGVGKRKIVFFYLPLFQ